MYHAISGRCPIVICRYVVSAGLTCVLQGGVLFAGVFSRRCCRAGRPRIVEKRTTIRGGYMATGRPSHRSPKQPYSARKRYLWALTGLPVVAAAGLYVAMAPGATTAQTQNHIGEAGGPSQAHTKPGSVTEVQAASQCTSQGGMTTGTGQSAACSVGGMGIAKMPAHPTYRPRPKPSASSASASASPSSPGSTAPSSSAPA